MACFKTRDVDRSQWLSSYHQRSRALVRFGNLRVSVSAAAEAVRRRTVKADHPRASVGTGFMAYEQPAERLAELAAHGAVDEEVDEIAEKDAEVDDAGSYRRWALVEHVQIEDITDDQRHEDDGHWKLDEQEDPDDDDQH